METRANFVLIGAFTILGFLGLLAFLLWFAKLEVDRQFAYYDIYFTGVSGLSASVTPIAKSAHGAAARDR